MARNEIEYLRELQRQWRIHQRLSSLYMPSPDRTLTRNDLVTRFRSAFSTFEGQGAFHANPKLLENFMNCAGLVEFTSQFDGDGETLRRGEDRAPLVWHTTPKKEPYKVQRQPLSIYLSIFGILHTDVKKIEIEATVKRMDDESDFSHSPCLTVFKIGGKVQSFTPYVHSLDFARNDDEPPARRGRSAARGVAHKKLCILLDETELQEERLFSRMGHLQIPIANVGLLKTGPKLDSMHDESEVRFDVRLWLKNFHPDQPIIFTVCSNRFIVSPGCNADKDSERFMSMAWNILHGCIEGNGVCLGAGQMEEKNPTLKWHVARRFLRNYLKIRNPACRNLDEQEIRLIQSKLFLPDAMKPGTNDWAFFGPLLYDQQNLNYGYQDQLQINDDDTAGVKKEKAEENRRRDAQKRRHFRLRLHNAPVRDDYNVTYEHLTRSCLGLLDSAAKGSHASVATYLGNVLQLIDCKTHQLGENLTAELRDNRNVGRHMLYLFCERFITLTDALTSYRIFRTLSRHEPSQDVKKRKQVLQLRIHEDEGDTLIIQYENQLNRQARPQCAPLSLCVIADAKKGGGLKWTLNRGHSLRYNAIVQLKGTDSARDIAPTFDYPLLHPEGSNIPLYPYYPPHPPIGQPGPSNSSYHPGFGPHSLPPLSTPPPLPYLGASGDDNQSHSRVAPSIGDSESRDHYEDHRIVLVPIVRLFGRRETATATAVLRHQIDPLTGMALPREGDPSIELNPDLDGFSDVAYSFKALSLVSQSSV